MTQQSDKISQIENKLNRLRKLRTTQNNINNEGAQDGYNSTEDRIAELSQQLVREQAKLSPLVTDLNGEREAFNSQGFKCPTAANKWCLERGYSLADLQAAAKAAK